MTVTVTLSALSRLKSKLIRQSIGSYLSFCYFILPEHWGRGRKLHQVNRAHLTNIWYLISRSFILIFAGVFYIKGTKYFTFRQYITNSFNGNTGDVSSREPPNKPAPRGTVNFGYHKAKLAKNTVKVEATDIRKETGFDKSKCMLQNNVILNLVL